MPLLVFLYPRLKLGNHHEVDIFVDRGKKKIERERERPAQPFECNVPPTKSQNQKQNFQKWGLPPRGADQRLRRIQRLRFSLSLSMLARSYSSRAGRWAWVGPSPGWQNVRPITLLDCATSSVQLQNTHEHSPRSPTVFPSVPSVVLP